MDTITLGVGLLLKDNSPRRHDRVVRLEYRINPMGPVPPYWRVKNVDTGRQTTIRENRLTPPRWEKASDQG